MIEQEPYCQLRFEGCTDVTTTADHIEPVILRPDLEFVRSNLQGACQPCNRKKSALTLEEATARYGGEEREQAPALKFFE